ncbi:MAG: RIP metalloprotease RseP [Nitrospinota bacterium]|nr:RIP metalloprotease RseP [Nitrospinota bacterium]
MSSIGFGAVFAAVSISALPGYIQFGATAILILALLIVVHEFGHFITARWVGVPVQVFSIGFGRKLWGRQAGETEFMVCAVPLGGYVKFYGDDADEELPEKYKDYSFAKEAVWKRLLIVLAGPLFNIILAVFIFALAAMVGWPEISEENYKTLPATVNAVVPDQPAHKAGIKSGDTITAVDGKATSTWVAFTEMIRNSPGKNVILAVSREGEGELQIPITPNVEKEPQMDGTEITVGKIGVSPMGIIKSYPPHIALIKGTEKTWQSCQLIVWVVYKLVVRDIPANQIAGPIGIMQMGGQEAEKGVAYLLMLIGLISVNLGIVNLLPIPILDGGHIFFFTIEAILGKPLNLRHQEIAQHIGMVMILMLMALAFYNDFVRIFAG